MIPGTCVKHRSEKTPCGPSDDPDRRSGVYGHELTPTGGGELAEGTQLEVIPEETCRRLLAEHHFGRVAVTDEHGPVVLPVNYAFVDGSVIFRTDPGTKLAAATSEQLAAFEIDDVDLDRRVGWSVLVRGRLVEVDDDAERAKLIDGISEPFPGGVRAHVVRIDATSISGRRIPLPRRVPSDWFEKPDLGNVWYGQDGTDLLG
jgi:uncharacterized protein